MNSPWLHIWPEWGSHSPPHHSMFDLNEASTGWGCGQHNHRCLTVNVELLLSSQSLSTSPVFAVLIPHLYSWYAVTLLSCLLPCHYLRAWQLLTFQPGCIQKVLMMTIKRIRMKQKMTTKSNPCYLNVLLTSDWLRWVIPTFYNWGHARQAGEAQSWPVQALSPQWGLKMCSRCGTSSSTSAGQDRHGCYAVPQQ